MNVDSKKKKYARVASVSPIRQGGAQVSLDVHEMHEKNETVMTRPGRKSTTIISAHECWLYGIQSVSFIICYVLVSTLPLLAVYLLTSFLVCASLAVR